MSLGVVVASSVGWLPGVVGVCGSGCGAGGVGVCWSGWVVCWGVDGVGWLVAAVVMVAGVRTAAARREVVSRVPAVPSGVLAGGWMWSGVTWAWPAGRSVRTVSWISVV